VVLLLSFSLGTLAVLLFHDLPSLLYHDLLLFLCHDRLFQSAIYQFAS
jgi:hypothetical protein